MQLDIVLKKEDLAEAVNDWIRKDFRSKGMRRMFERKPEINIKGLPEQILANLMFLEEKIEEIEKIAV